ncbi:MAG: hypothetical protein K6G55_05080 [Selenomonadaceae bacterium]|nr:hypothetical protein [Selenomonadaceae bacterium]
MKKVLLAMVFMLGLMFTQQPTAQAYDQYVGTSDATGFECYLMTETISERSRNRGGAIFWVRLKMVGRSVQYLDYELQISNNGYSFHNDQGFSGVATKYGTPIEWNMCEYVARNYL